MYTTLERNETTLIRDRSSFIGILIHLTNINLVKQYLFDIKKQYPKAKHYCYAYIVGNNKKCSDDGEPAKTAGRPLLELLEKKNMDECLLVVVRYFGGILLGASRLMSTYIEAGVQVIDSADIVEAVDRYIYKLDISYKDYDNLQRIIKKTTFSLENVKYEDTIKVEVLADEKYGEELANMFPQAILELYGTKKIYKKV